MARRKKAEVKQEPMLDVKAMFEAINEIERDYRIDQDKMKEILASSFQAAYKKDTGESVQIAIVMNETKQTLSVYSYRDVVDNVEDEEKQILLEEANEKGAQMDPPKEYKVGDVLLEEIHPETFSRSASTVAKQLILSKILETRNQYVLNEMSNKKGTIMNSVIRRKEGPAVYVDFPEQQVEGILLPGDQIKSERYNVGDVLKVYIKNIKESTSNNRGSQIFVSRSAAGYVRALMMTEIPEIRVGLVKIVNIVREGGGRTKIAVSSDDPNIDPVSACIGPKGVRINEIVSDIGGEKVDIIEYSEDPNEYIFRALSPAQPLVVSVDPDAKTAKVIVADEKLSLAIGRNGQNARLAAKLTGYKIDVKPFSSTLENKEEDKGE